MPSRPLVLHNYRGAYVSDEERDMALSTLGSLDAGPVEGTEGELELTLTRVRRSCLRVIAMARYLYKRHRNGQLDLISVANPDAQALLQRFMNLPSRGVAFDPKDWIVDGRLNEVFRFHWQFWIREKVPIAYIWWPKYFDDPTLKMFNPGGPRERSYIENLGSLPSCTFLVANCYRDDYAFPVTAPERRIYEAKCFSEKYQCNLAKVNVQVGHNVDVHDWLLI